MQVLDKIAEWIESMLAKIGLCKDRKEEEKYAKYPNIDRKIQKKIYNTSFNYDYDPEVDTIVNNVVKFKNKMTKFTHEFCYVKIEFENGTTVRLWVENCWYAFLNSVKVNDKDKKNHKNFDAKRPSPETMINFLNAYSEYFDIEENRVTQKKLQLDDYYVKMFFNFDHQEEKNESKG